MTILLIYDGTWETICMTGVGQEMLNVIYANVGSLDLGYENFNAFTVLGERNSGGVTHSYLSHLVHISNPFSPSLQMHARSMIGYLRAI